MEFRFDLEKSRVISALRSPTREDGPLVRTMWKKACVLENDPQHRYADEARELTDKIGRAVPVGFTASKVTWLARHEPDNWQRTDGVLLPHDFINLRLTGERTMEAGDLLPSCRLPNP